MRGRDGAFAFPSPRLTGAAERRVGFPSPARGHHSHPAGIRGCMCCGGGVGRSGDTGVNASQSCSTEPRVGGAACAPKPALAAVAGQ